jgi:hypothetical protein
MPCLAYAGNTNKVQKTFAKSNDKHAIYNPKAKNTMSGNHMARNGQNSANMVFTFFSELSLRA